MFLLVGKNLTVRCAMPRQRQIKQTSIPLLLYMFYSCWGKDLWPQSHVEVRSRASLVLRPGWSSEHSRA